MLTGCHDKVEQRTVVSGALKPRGYRGDANSP